MIDFHTHVLPDIDDGAKDIEESLAMLDIAYKNGVKICVATPHCIIHNERAVEKFLSAREESYNRLKQRLPADCPKLYLGAEVYLDHDISAHPQLDKLCIENTSCILLEFPRTNWDLRIFEWIYSIASRGLTPIIAHIDRYSKRNLILNELNNMGCIFQVNSSNFTNPFGRHLLRKLFKSGHTFLASCDMHNTKSRSCNMAKAYSRAKLFFPKRADELFKVGARELFGF